MKLSKNFTLEELTLSQTAVRRGLKNQPTADEIKYLERLCKEILQPLRDRVKKPIRISSGFRSNSVNKLIGGSHTSQHCKGQAADLTITGMPVDDVCNLIIDLCLPYHQLISEFDSWVHVSIAPNGTVAKKERLRAARNKGRVIYTKVERF